MEVAAKFTVSSPALFSLGLDSEDGPLLDLIVSCGTFVWFCPLQEAQKINIKSKPDVYFIIVSFLVSIPTKLQAFVPGFSKALVKKCKRDVKVAWIAECEC
jgi:hypothetical protein